METNHIKNPYLRSFPPSPGGIPPRKQQRTTITEKEEAVLLPSYADPSKIRKYQSIATIFGERPAYVMQKKRRYEQTVWMRDSVVLDVIGTSRTYYPKARWARGPNFCTCPCEPKCYQSYRDFKTFSDEAWSSDDDDFSESYYNNKSELMCVRHERTGKILKKGETIVPGVGVVMLEQNFDTAARTGRIFPTTDTILETSFHPDGHLVDPYGIVPLNKKRVLSDSFLTPTKLHRYLSGHPTTYLPKQEARHTQTVPTVLFRDARPNAQVYEPVEGTKIKVENVEDDCYVPSTGSQTLLSHTSQPEDDDSSTIVPTNEERDPSETAASAIKAFLSDEEEDSSEYLQKDDYMKCNRCHCAPCIWVQKGHMVQKKHNEAVRRALLELKVTTLPNWHLRRLYFAEMTIQMWGPLGWERKTIIPDCVVDCVRGLFPEPKGIFNYPKWS
jgi:hypothetical protein